MANRGSTAVRPFCHQFNLTRVLSTNNRDCSHQSRLDHSLFEFAQMTVYELQRRPCRHRQSPLSVCQYLILWRRVLQKEEVEQIDRLQSNFNYLTDNVTYT